jgi:ABC-type tungstate transport system permease subunit
MSQSPLQVSTASPLSGLNEVIQTNAALAALATLQSSTAAPTFFSTGSGSTALREGQMWLDTSVTPHVARFYSSTGGFIVTFLTNAAPNAAFIASNWGI